MTLSRKRNPQPSESVDALVDRWTLASGDNQHLSDVRDLLRFLADEIYDEYQPFADKPLFWERLAHWLQNVKPDADRQLLLELVPWLLFIGREELETMYWAAFNGPITRWIIDEAGLDIADADLSDRFREELRVTYFGSMAGMEINSFSRINGLAGQGHRPNFREHSQLGDFDRFKDEIVSQGFQRVVAVEDMVGTGTQMCEATPILAYLAPMKVLLCPIVVAPSGVVTWTKKLRRHHPQFEFAPFFVIPSNATLPATAKANEAAMVSDLRSLLKSTWRHVKGQKPTQPLYGPFGFGRFGSLVLSYLNCPDNVPPLIHHESDQWTPLFPRLARGA